MRCESCGTAFEPRHPKARFCSDKCRAAAWKQGRVKVQAGRDWRVRMLLEEALRVLTGEGEDSV